MFHLRRLVALTACCMQGGYAVRLTVLSPFVHKEADANSGYGALGTTEVIKHLERLEEYNLGLTPVRPVGSAQVLNRQLNHIFHYGRAITTQEGRIRTELYKFKYWHHDAGKEATQRVRNKGEGDAWDWEPASATVESTPTEDYLDRMPAAQAEAVLDFMNGEDEAATATATRMTQTEVPGELKEDAAEDIQPESIVADDGDAEELKNEDAAEDIKEVQPESITAGEWDAEELKEMGPAVIREHLTRLQRYNKLVELDKKDTKFYDLGDGSWLGTSRKDRVATGLALELDEGETGVEYSAQVLLRQLARLMNGKHILTDAHAMKIKEEIRGDYNPPRRYSIEIIRTELEKYWRLEDEAEQRHLKNYRGYFKYYRLNGRSPIYRAPAEKISRT